ncbi:CvfD/Ygs/GSP13 family RNA-binding post-transcriptional regulator [Brochothrix thermosphacta]|uniref:CvfD/Ygs/GSP13 family RNA-binding post-transcriptional regulator n=1 Tax=Brochothrix thermosphacta TaxID=2756 RepID=UPI00265CA41C|nr:CvfD/Ygs/GSP13 family RNA-binding post-transcriptional regulator [Brochothrix thermosphacta]WKK69233.1 CvfD/Ygs/GSP13 family RNA-binding post-transcriptional regulator [Brochothrix thermosphacta]
MAKFKVGDVVEGTVDGIQKYGAFIKFPDETQGLIHISEVTHGFVKDINDYLHVGQKIKVEIVSMEEDKKRMSLSLRAMEDHENSEEGEAGFEPLRKQMPIWIDAFLPKDGISE